MSTIENKKKGDVFEKYIISLYEALNFHVIPNISINGQQVDIVAEKSIPGVGKIKSIIDCKYLTTGSVSNQVVYDWSNFVKSITKDEYIISGVIVSNQLFSKDARAAAAKTNITLLTQEQLESEIFQLKESYLRNIKSYEQSAIYEIYLPLNGVEKSNKGYGKEVVNIGKTIIDKDYDIWKQTKFLTILADFGSGKTTLMQWLNYQYSKKYMEGSSVKPLYFELKYFFQYQDIDLYAVNTYRKLFQKDIPSELFWKSVSNGDFIILLDGFDEMSSQVDRQIRIRNFQMLSRLLLSKSNTIISCRSSYFISDEEFFRSVEELNTSNQAPELNLSKQKIDRLIKKEKQTKALYQALIHKYTDDQSLTAESEKVNAKAHVIEISELNKSQIENYLAKFDSDFREKCEVSWEEVKDFCYKIYDIRDLLKKPILISMVKDTMLFMGKNFRTNNEVFDPSSLYETYTSANLQRDFKKGLSRQYLTTNQRKYFAEAIAFLMFEKNTLEVDLSELYDVIIKNASILERPLDISDKTMLEHTSSDIVLCAFIKKAENGKFKFIHKSFMEFFVARKIKNLLLKNDLTILRQTLVSQEILYFIGCYSSAEIQLYNLLLKEVAILGNPKSKSILKRNFAIAVLVSTNNHTGLLILDANINETKFSGQVFYECTLTGLNFNNITMSEINFKDCPALKLKLNNSTIDHIIFQKSNVNIDFINVNAIQVQFNSCETVQINGEELTFKELSVIHSSIRGSGYLSTESAVISNSKMNFTTITSHIFFRSSFDIVEYQIKNGNTVVFREAEIKNSLLTLRPKEINFDESRLTQTDMDLNGKILISNCIWKLCSCKWSGIIVCISNEFESVVFKQSEKQSSFLFSDDTFESCHFIGISMNVKNVREFFRCRFKSCRGVIIVDDEEDALDSLKFKKSGTLNRSGLFFISPKLLSVPLDNSFLNDIEISLRNDQSLDTIMSKYNLVDSEI